MKYCLECDSEYEDNVTICVDCNAPLVSQEEYATKKAKMEKEQQELDQSELVELQVANTKVEAFAIRDALSDQDIPVMVRSFEDSAYDGVFVAQQGWGVIEVLPRDKDKAEAIVEDLETAYEQAPQNPTEEDSSG